MWGFDKLIESHTGIETYVADDAISCVANGTGRSLEWVNEMQDGTFLFVRNSLQSRPAPFLRTPCRPLVAASGHRRALFGIIT